MVRPTQPNDLGPRPSIHVSLRQSTGDQARGVSEPINGLSPPNGRTLGTQEPMDRTVPSPSHGRTTRRLVSMALNRDSGPQRSNQRHVRNVPQRSSPRISPSTLPGSTNSHEQRKRRKSDQHSPSETRPSYSRHQSRGENTRYSKRCVQTQRPSVARIETSSPAPSIKKTSPETCRPLPHHKSNIASRVSSRPTVILAYP